ncbi:MAG: hypothetical protein U0R52_02390 [Solirubrobacterales bacterium]
MSRRHAGGRLGAGRAGGDRARPVDSLGQTMLRQVPVLIGAFALGVAVAELFGAANLGVAFGVGQLCFAAAVVFLILRD